MALPRFTPTLAPFRVRSEQLNRCLTYLTSTVGWVGLISIIAITWNTVHTALRWCRRVPVPSPLSSWYLGFEPLEGVPTLLDQSQQWWWWWSRRASSAPMFVLSAALPLAMLWSFVFEYVALRSYLRLTRRDAMALTLSTQVVAFLTLA